MKRLLTTMLCLVALASVFTDAAEMPDWQNPAVNQRNRLPMSTTYDAGGLNLSLSGIWKFNWNETAESRPMDF